MLWVIFWISKDTHKLAGNLIYPHSPPPVDKYLIELLMMPINKF